MSQPLQGFRSLGDEPESSITQLKAALPPDEVFRSGVLFRQTTIGVDVSAKFLMDLVGSIGTVVSPIRIQLSELMELEQRMERLKAIDDVFGSLSGLPADRIRDFDEAVRRKPFFDEVPP